MTATEQRTARPVIRIRGLALVLLTGLMVYALTAMAAPAQKKGDARRGAKVWADNCGRCHNTRDARELRDDQWVSTAYHMRIRAGLTGQETRDVIAFLTATNDAPRTSVFADSGTAKTGARLSGEAIYKQVCVACHGADGKGTLPGAPDFTSRKGPLAKTDKVLIKNITQGYQSPGSPMAMPAKGGKADLTAADIRAVLAYLRRRFGKP